MTTSRATLSLFMRRLAGGLVLAVLIAGMAALLRPGLPALAADSDKGFLADLISRALSTQSSQVSIGAVEGALTSDATVRDIAISDRDGPWLKLDRVRLIWTRSALFQRRLEVDRLEIGRLEIVRRPVKSATPPSAEPLLPELPVKVEIKVFELKELVLGTPVIGTAARVSSSGMASLGSPAQGLLLKLNADRLDAPGSFGVSLSFVPATNALQTTLMVDEPPGGLIAHLADLPAQSPVRLDLSGSGTLDSFMAKLVFAAGETIGAEGSARLDRAGTERRLALDLASRVEGLMPASVAPVFAGKTALTGSLRFVDDGSISVDRLSLLSHLAKLDIAGAASADRTLDFTLAAKAVPNDGARTKANDTELGALNFVGTIKGPALGPTVDATLTIADARLSYGHFDGLDARFTAKPSGALDDDKSALDLVGDGHLRGLALADPGLARAVGDRIDFALRGTTSADGVTRFEALKLTAPGGEFAYQGLLGRTIIDGKVSVALADLSRLSTLAGRPLTGAFTASATLAGSPNREMISAALEGSGSRITTAIPAFDSLTGNTLKLSGRLTTHPDRAVAVDHVVLTGAFIDAQADGLVGAAVTDLNASISLPDLSRADKRLTGRAALTTKVTGSSDRVDATTTIAVSDTTALGRSVPSLGIEARLTDLFGALQAEATLKGTVDGKPAAGSVAVGKRPDGGWQLPVLDVSIGSVKASGALELSPDQFGSGTLTIAAGNLDDLSALALTKLSGRLDATLQLAVPNGRQAVKLNAEGLKIAIAETAIERLTATLDIADAYVAPSISADVSVDKARIGGQSISSLRLTSVGTPLASDFRLSAKAAGFDLAGNGRLTPGDPIRLDIAAVEARRDGRRIALASPASLSFDKTGLAIRSLVLGIDGGRLAISGHSGPELDLTLDANAVPLAAARIVSPTLDVSGTLDAHARIGGSAQRPTGPWTLKIANLALPQMRAAGLPPLSVNGSGLIAGDRTSMAAAIALPRGGSLDLRGSVPMSEDATLALEAKGQLDAALANTILAPGGRSLTGRVSLDLKGAGTLRAPVLNGAIDLKGGTANDALQGIALSAVDAHLVAHGAEISIEHASAATRNGGTLRAAGRIKVDPAAGFPAAIRITGRKAELVSNPFVTAVADLDLDITGPLARHPRLGGTVTLTSLEVDIAERLPTTLRPVDNIRHVNAPPAVRRQLAGQAKKSRVASSRRAAPPFDATLALAISAPNRVFVRGRGLDAELGGDLKVGGSLVSPIVSGGFDLRRGRFTIVGQRLDFTRGRVTFTGDLVPELDFVAQTQASDVTAIITVAGTASQPSFVFSSQPDLPQDEVLSRILFAKASGSLSPFQALQLAQAAAQFSGTGDDAFERLRKSLGVDNLDVQFGANGPTVGVSRAIGDRLSVGVKTGVKTEESGVTVGIDVTRRLKLQLEGTANGGAAAGVGTEIEY